MPYRIIFYTLAPDFKTRRFYVLETFCKVIKLQQTMNIILINTAIIKGKEKKIDTAYEERLNIACNSSAIQAISSAITQLAQKDKISYDIIDLPQNNLNASLLD